MDTQRLATHVFMSHKFRLRAEHLSLHKAICVLLGWKSGVVPDVSTWVPEHIPCKEAMTQKEDVILRVVRFSGTFSGLQDAEGLHKYFVDNKRGRDSGRGGPQFQQGQKQQQ